MRWFSIVLVVGLLAACGADTTDTTDTTKDQTSTAQAPGETSGGGWVQLPDPPLAPRNGSVIGWTGEEIVVVGGSAFLCPPNADCAMPDEPPFMDGAALDPETREWRPIADAPVPVPSHSPTARLDDDVYILVSPWAGISFDRSTTLLRYRSVEDTWEASEVPVDARLSGLLASGTGLVVYSGSDELGETPDLWFSPEDSSWSELPADPLSPSFDRGYAWDGTDLHLFARDITPSPGGESGPAVATAAVLEDGEWRELPTGDVLGFWSVISDGDRLVDPSLGCADGGETNNYGRCIPLGAVFDTAAERWSDLPNAPSRGEKHVWSSGAVTSDEVLLTGLGGHMLDLTTDTWFAMPRIDDPDTGATVERTFAGAGPYAIAVGGTRFDDRLQGGRLLGEAWLWTRDP